MNPFFLGRSSLFVSGKAIALFGCGAVVSAVFHLSALSAVLAFLCFFCLASRLWGEGALRNIGVETEFYPGGLFPQGTVELKLRVKNEKWLPVIWLEVFQPLGEKDALAPCDEEIVQEDGQRFLRRKFTFLMGQEELLWTSHWTAQRRGLFHPEQMLLQAGDGFGLTQACRRIGAAGRSVAVYPALQPVSPELFLRDLWDCSSGAKGYLEDPTVIQSTRDYQRTDPVKRINWRLTARTQRTVVNTYETILPKAAHFIVDCESFNGVQPQEAAFEDTLSILTSLLVELHHSGMRCGVSLPRSLRSAAAEYSPDASLEEILRAFAGYAFYPLEKPEDPHDPPRVLPAVFREEILQRENVGRFYYVCASVEQVKHQRFFQRLESSRTVLLPYTSPSASERAALRDFTIVPLTTLKRGDGHDQ